MAATSRFLLLLLLLFLPFPPPRRLETLVLFSFLHRAPSSQTFFPPENTTDYAKATATQKAIEVATRLEKDERVPFMVIGADTVVEAPDGSIMEKPKVGTVFLVGTKLQNLKNNISFWGAERDENFVLRRRRENATERMLTKR